MALLVLVNGNMVSRLSNWESNEFYYPASDCSGTIANLSCLLDTSYSERVGWLALDYYHS
jgi:hypothetical protein